MEGQRDPIAVRVTKSKQNESIMATNNSSIVSKRSVERLYQPEPHFFRYFVKKPHRRSPLINRGYWLRMYAVERVVREFLDEISGKKKLILNLGCGYDTLAFQQLSKNASKCVDAKFIDIDYPDLITRKISTIFQTPQIVDLLATCIAGEDDNKNTAILRSEHYIAIGCDLADTTKLNAILANEVDLETYSILSIAEVSITYMNVGAADALIKWACLLKDCMSQIDPLTSMFNLAWDAKALTCQACFCLLEQFLPNGSMHPFARRMIQHFDNLKTPLRSIHEYPNLKSQERRFLDAGWSSANARSLWDLWGDASFITSLQKVALNKIEPFDEWEELMLFASHYFLLFARKTSTTMKQHSLTSRLETHADHSDFIQSIATSEQHHGSYFDILEEPGCYRRFGASVSLSEDTMLHHGGLGVQRRLNTTQVYKSGSKATLDLCVPPLNMEPRMCHTITRLAEGRCILVGGRTSPDHALSDCWLYNGKSWERIEDLPVPLYRHSATVISLGTPNERVLIYGGRSSGGSLFNDWLLWHNSTGWIKLTVAEGVIQPRFGAAISFIGPRHGVLLGGMAGDGSVIHEIWNWSIFDTDTNPSILLSQNCSMNCANNNHLAVICRLGACVTWFSNDLLIIGGVTKQLLPQSFDVIRLIQKSVKTVSDEINLETVPINYPSGCQGSLMIGHSASSLNGSVAIIGGGSVCFSFGTHWNHGMLVLQSSVREPSCPWTPAKKNEFFCDSGQQESKTDNSLALASFLVPDYRTKKTVENFNLPTSRQFEKTINDSKPFVMEKMELGTCLTRWTLEFLKETVGAERSIVVHEATEQHMDFTRKNFRYVRKLFGQFIDEINEGSQQYLRSLAIGMPSVKPADFMCDFPELASDFQLPPQLKIVVRDMHSSPLRISGPVVMWLHYDVMANVLFQIRGSKRIILYPPSDVSHLQISPGESSSSINVFDKDALTRYPSLMHAHPQEAILHPGDVLYIPPLWFHTALPLENFSIAINIFFRNLKSGYAAGRDVYGNRDLQAYEYGRKEVEKISKAFEGLPPQMARFYLERLARELNQKACQYGDS